MLYINFKQGDGDRKSWATFQERICKAPGQVLRYFGTPLDEDSYFHVSFGKKKINKILSQLYKHPELLQLGLCAFYL